MDKNINNMPLEFVKKLHSKNDLEKSLEGEVCVFSKDDTLWYQNSVMPIFDSDGKHLGEVLVRYDITQKKKFEELSITDSLTKLYNRRFFNDTLNREIKKAQREKSKLSFLILDIDYFKKYNDSYGHDAGDKALQSVANAIKNSLHRGSDYAFRLGGEEFGVIFSTKTQETSLQLANFIRQNVSNLKIEHSNSLVENYITVSIGLLFVDFNEENVDAHGFYTMADDALYQAKENGRNQVVLYENETLEFF